MVVGVSRYAAVACGAWSGETRGGAAAFAICGLRREVIRTGQRQRVGDYRCREVTRRLSRRKIREDYCAERGGAVAVHVDLVILREAPATWTVAA